MGENSSIEWTDHTFNAWIGCAKVSEGCAHCYAEREAGRWWAGEKLWGPRADRRVAAESYWKQPVAWNAKAEAAGVRKKVFANSMSDWLEDRPDLLLPRRRLIRLIEDTPWLDWLMLTKHPQNARLFLLDHPPNLWFGTSAENQRRLDERLPHLLSVPARVRFLSIEPLLAPIFIPFDDEFPDPDGCYEDARFGIHWVIVGGESGPGYRVMRPEWAEHILWQCWRAKVPFFMKQMGGWPKKRGALDEMPRELRVRQFPGAG